MRSCLVGSGQGDCRRYRSDGEAVRQQTHRRPPRRPQGRLAARHPGHRRLPPSRRPPTGARQPTPAGRNVEHDELTALLAVCAADPRPAGARDAAIIALAYLSGGRRAELAGLDLADLDLDPPAIRVVGKGGRQRLVPLSPTATPVIDAWLARRGDQPGPLFCPINRGDNLQHGRTLSGEAIRQVLGRRSLTAGVKALSPHDLRRSYAGDLLDAGADLPAVQQLLGHASPATTSRYDRRGDKARRTAAERGHLKIPTRSTDDDGSPG